MTGSVKAWSWAGGESGAVLALEGRVEGGQSLTVDSGWFVVVGKAEGCGRLLCLFSARVSFALQQVEVDQGQQRCTVGMLSARLMLARSVMGKGRSCSTRLLSSAEQKLVVAGVVV